MGTSKKHPLVKVKVTFNTPHQEAPPETEGPLKGLPRTTCIEYIRIFKLDYESLFVGHVVEFYGRPYRITSYGLSQKELGIQVTDEEVTQLLADAKLHNQRLKKRVGGLIDGRSLVWRALYGARL